MAARKLDSVSTRQDPTAVESPETPGSRSSLENHSSNLLRASSGATPPVQEPTAALTLARRRKQKTDPSQSTSGERFACSSRLPAPSRRRRSLRPRSCAVSKGQPSHLHSSRRAFSMCFTMSHRTGRTPRQPLPWQASVPVRRSASRARHFSERCGDGLLPRLLRSTAARVTTTGASHTCRCHRLHNKLHPGTQRPCAELPTIYRLNQKTTGRTTIK